MSRGRFFLWLILAVTPFIDLAADGGMSITLKFMTQESVASSSPVLSPDVTDRSVNVVIEDSRVVRSPEIIGQLTDDDDRPWPVKASNSVVGYVNEIVGQLTDEWGLKRSTTADRTLVVRLTKFHVDESNKAVGSMYVGEVTFAYILKDARGKALTQGSVMGDARRYGKASSAQNMNEVLSDALKEAYASVLAEESLQTAWASGKASGKISSIASPQPKQSVPCPELTPEERLKRLDEMLKKGLITKTEYSQKRAEILKDL